MEILIKGIVWRILMIILSFVMAKLFRMKTSKAIGYTVTWNITTFCLYYGYEYLWLL
jgi:hypothetical protein